MTRYGAAATLVLLLVAPIAAQPPTLETAVERLMAYTERYTDALSMVIADERYSQWTERPGPSSGGGSSSTRSNRRTIRSEFVLARLSGDWMWFGYRDTYEVDGVAVRDRRDDRLARLLSSTVADERDEIHAIAEANARFNVASGVVNRNINVPTLVVQILHPRYRDRFGFNRAGAETIDGHRTWRLDFRELARPTLVRRRDDEDQPVRGTVWVDPVSGDVWRTKLTWEEPPAGSIFVAYGHAPGIDPLVPLTMTERYVEPPIEIRGEATYSQFRQFRTAARVLPR
jgi:hypothetical protein